MPIWLIDTAKPKNNGNFPIAEATDIAIDPETDVRLDEYLKNLTLGGVSPGVGLYLNDAGELCAKIAATDQLGLVKIGTNLKIDADGTLHGNYSNANASKAGLMSSYDYAKLLKLPNAPYNHTIHAQYHNKTWAAFTAQLLKIDGEFIAQYTDYSSANTSDLLAHLRQIGKSMQRNIAIPISGRLLYKKYERTYDDENELEESYICNLLRLDYDYSSDLFTVVFFKNDDIYTTVMTLLESSTEDDFYIKYVSSVITSS